MNVMQRPLFRASGGEAFPDLSGDGKVTQKDILMGRGVIPRGMEEGGLAALMPAPEAAMMEEAMVDPAMMEGGPLNPAEAEFAGDLVSATQEGEQMGLGYLAQTMDGIDNASNTEELINSIRGTSQPLEARVQELATFVGEEDAMRTPESVLTMVQPVIMMTDEGAIDTGIGELMQGVMGDTEMSANMGQGVGALMAQGQPAPEMAPQMAPPPPMPAAMPPMAPPPQMAQAPMAPPQQFAAGGPVVHMAEAGDPAKKQLALQAYFDEYLPVYENLIGSSNEDREKDRALALAKAGFQFASGRDAKGQNIAGSGFLANLASAGAGFTDDIGAIDREQRKLAQGTKTLALQSAFSTDQAKRAADASMAEKAFDRNTKLKVEALKVLAQGTDFEISEIGTNVEGEPVFGLYNRKDPTGRITRIDPNNLSEVESLLSGQQASSAPTTALPPVTEISDEQTVRTRFDKVADIGPFIQKDLRRFNAAGLNTGDQDRLSNNLERYYEPTTDLSGNVMAMPLSQVDAMQIVKAVDREDNPLVLSPALVDKARSKVANPNTTPIDEFYFLVDDIKSGKRSVDLIPKEGKGAGRAYGIPNTLLSGYGSFTEQVEEITGMKPTFGADLGEDAFNAAQETKAFRNFADNLATQTLKALQESQGQRPLKSITDIIIDEVKKIKSSATGTRREALRTARGLRKKLKIGFDANMDIIDKRSIYDKADVGFAQSAALSSLMLVKQYDALISGLEASLGDVTDEGPIIDATQDASGLSYEERVAAARAAFSGVK